MFAYRLFLFRGICFGFHGPSEEAVDAVALLNATLEYYSAVSILAATNGLLSDVGTLNDGNISRCIDSPIDLEAASCGGGPSVT